MSTVSKDSISNALRIYNEHFSDKNMPCSLDMESRINFTTRWMNIRYIFEVIFKDWFKESVSWTRFIRKHCLIDGRKANTHNKNTSQYKDRADNHVKRMVDYIYRNVVGEIPPHK